jgi:hypothetical protein
MKFLVAAQFSILQPEPRSECKSPALNNRTSQLDAHCTVLTDGSCTLSNDSYERAR